MIYQVLRSIYLDESSQRRHLRCVCPLKANFGETCLENSSHRVCVSSHLDCFQVCLAPVFNTKYVYTHEVRTCLLHRNENYYQENVRIINNSCLLPANESLGRHITRLNPTAGMEGRTEEERALVDNWLKRAWTIQVRRTLSYVSCVAPREGWPSKR